MAAVSPIRPAATPQPAEAAGAQPRGAGFREVVESALGSVEQANRQASQSVEAFLAGEGGELHSTLLAVQRAELALDLFLQVRNKVVQAYQEIMRMQI